MVTFPDLEFGTRLGRVEADPLVGGAACDEDGARNGIERGGGRRVGKSVREERLSAAGNEIGNSR